MKVSFCIPAYKGKFLKKTLDSLVRQTLDDIEIIVVDDRSPDGLKQIVDEVNDPRIRYFLNEENLGRVNPLHNYNKAFSYARGEFAVVAGDDDIYHPEFAEKMVELARRYPDVNVFHCRIGIIDADDNLMTVGDLWPEWESCVDYIFSRGVRRCQQRMPEFLVRTEALRQVGGMVEMPLAWYSDDATWLLLSREKGIVTHPEMLFRWRYSGSNISSRFDITEKKVLAAEAYKVWLKEFLLSIKVDSETDKRILGVINEQIWNSVDQQTLWDLDDTKFRLWFRLMRTMKLDRRFKLRSIRNRLRKIIHL